MLLCATHHTLPSIFFPLSLVHVSCVCDARDILWPWFVLGTRKLTIVMGILSGTQKCCNKSVCFCTDVKRQRQHTHKHTFYFIHLNWGRNDKYSMKQILV